MQREKRTNSPFFVNILNMKSKITDFLANHLSPDLFVVKVSLSKNNNQVNVYLDGDYGVAVEECGKVSKKLEAFLDEQPSIPADYTLNVSSAGLNQPLQVLRQFKKNVNRNLKVSNQKTEKIGKLVFVDENKIVLKVQKGEAISFDFNEITEAKVEI